MLKRRVAIGILVISVIISACETTGDGQKTGGGEILGAIIGGLSGALIGESFGDGMGQAIATGIGAAAGMAIGASIGRALDEADRARHESARKLALNQRYSGTLTWSNPINETGGEIIPLRTYSNSGRRCKDVVEAITIKGQTERTNNTYCAEEDGTWTFLN